MAALRVSASSQWTLLFTPCSLWHFKAICLKLWQTAFHPSSLHPYCWKVWEDGAEVENRSVGIITAWRTRMDLYAISPVKHCANLLSTNGTVKRATYVFFLVLFATFLVTGRFFISSRFIPDVWSIHDEPLEMEYKAFSFFWKSEHLAASLLCLVSCASSLIAQTQSFNHASNLSSPRSQEGFFKIKFRILCRTATSKSWLRVPWHTFKDCCVFPVSERGLVYISCQHTNGCSGSLKWDSQL